MRILIPGGTGHVGAVLVRELEARGHTVTLISRSPQPGQLRWDGKTLGEWADAVDGCDAVLNLAGRTVDCRYNPTNLRQMMDSRVDSTRVVGQAIARAKNPPAVWLQMSTATIYAHNLDDPPHDETRGVLGGNEPGVPALWKRSIDVAEAWERTQAEAVTPHTRRVALRTAMVMSPDRGSVFDVLLRLVRLGLGGPIAGGRQWMSWIHDQDFAAAVDHLLTSELDGPVNLASPEPLTQREFMAAMRRAWGIGIGLPATAWMLEIGAFVLRTESELVLKSRKVVPGRLLADGFRFAHPSWPEAAAQLVARWRGRDLRHVRPTVGESHGS